VGKFSPDRSPFDFHGRARIIFEHQMTVTELTDFPAAGSIKTNPIPGYGFPFVRQFYKSPNCTG